jgi:glutamyl-Q tRNA(Asp) synthetase
MAADGGLSGGSGYVGRFAPSPSGPLHAGSLVAALGSWLDARAQGGRWLLRIEDVDAPRSMAGAAQTIERQLHALGLVPDEPPVRQSQRGALYQAALDRLIEAGLAYPCGCTRRAIEVELEALGQPAQAGRERVYPGTCRGGLQGKPARAWRLRCGDAGRPVSVDWHDRRLGARQQDVTHAVGDFVLRRADGPWAYQLAVVVDDAAQGVSDVVRGEDLADNTARQIVLQRLLGLPTPRYLHLPLVRDGNGLKLSKSHGAPPLDTERPLEALRAAGQALGLPALPGGTVAAWLAHAIAAWRSQWPL